MAISSDAIKRKLKQDKTNAGTPKSPDTYVTGPVTTTSTGGSVAGPAPVPEGAPPVGDSKFTDWLNADPANREYYNWKSGQEQPKTSSQTFTDWYSDPANREYYNWKTGGGSSGGGEPAQQEPVDWEGLRRMLDNQQVDTFPADDPRSMELSPVRPVRLEQWGLPTDQNLEQQARDAVDLEYGSELRAIDEAQRQAIARFNQMSDEQRLYGENADPRIKNIYEALQNSLGQNQEANQETYQDAIGQIRGWYDQVYGDSADLNQSIMDRITTDAERLGIEAAIPAGTQELTEDFQYNQLQNRESQAGRSANMAELAAKIEALDRNRVGAAGREGAQERATLANEIAQTLGQLSIDHNNELAQMRGEAIGLKGEKGAAQRQALADLQQRQFDNTQTARGNALEEMLSRAGLDLQRAGYNRGNYEADRNFGLAQDELGLSRDQFLADTQIRNRGLDLEERSLSAQERAANQNNALAWAELELDKRALNADQERWQAELDQANSPEAKARAQAELDRIRAETEALNAESAATQYAPGEFGFQQYIKDNGVNPFYEQQARTILNQAQKVAMEKGLNPPDVAFQIIELGSKDPAAVAEQYGLNWNPENTQTLRNLITIYYAGKGQ